MLRVHLHTSSEQHTSNTTLTPFPPSFDQLLLGKEVEKIFKVIQSQVDNTHRKFEVGARNLDKKEFKW